MINKTYRNLFLHLPLITVIAFVALMTVPRSVFVPWEYLNVWTVLKAFSLSYILLGAISLAAKLKQLWVHLTLVGVTVGIVSIGACWLSFGGFRYLTSWSNAPAFFVISIAYLLAGYRAIMGCKSDQQMRVERVGAADA